jgi:diguanylate cyclase (GGDEF)-like protein
MSRAVRYLLPALIAGHIAWRLISPNESAVRDLVLYNLIWLVALIAVIYAPLTLDRVALGAIALAVFSWGVGSLATSFDELYSDNPRFTIPTQVLYTLFYPLILIAIPRLSALTAKLRPIELLDSLIFGLGFTSMAATLLLVTIFPADTLTGSSDFFTIFYPVGDLALLLIAITTLITRGIDRQSLYFAAGVLVFALTDFYYLWLALNHRYSFGSIADNGWLIAVALIAHSTSCESKKKEKFTPIHSALVAVSIFISPILLAISALKPNIFPMYILIPSIANLLLAFIRMSTALREARTLVSERMLARTDELTGLANRRRMLAEIENFSHAEGAFMLLDLDQFKPVNDQYGHEVGDLLLRQVAQRFMRTLPTGAILARLGGDEFGVLVRGSYEETLESAHALRASLTYPFTVRGVSIQVGVSIGYVHNDGAGNLLKRADDAMYRAKQMDMGVAQL